MAYGGNLYYYMYNLEGDVVGLYKDNGTLVARYTYNPWGKILSIKDQNGTNVANNASHIANINPFRYRGYYYDVESSLYYLNSRYYNPELGRFINADSYTSTAQGVLSNNMFTYCLNNPVNRIDPDGTCSFCGAQGIAAKYMRDTVGCGKKKTVAPPVSPPIKPTGTITSGNNIMSVYIVPENQVNNVKSQNTKGDVVIIIDKRDRADPNMQILDSHKISDKNIQGQIIDMMFDYNNKNPVNPAWSRTKDSCLSEWKIHNFLYNIGYEQNRTADCDFNNADELKFNPKPKVTRGA